MLTCNSLHYLSLSGTLSVVSDYLSSFFSHFVVAISLSLWPVHDHRFEAGARLCEASRFETGGCLANKRMFQIFYGCVRASVWLCGVYWFSLIMSVLGEGPWNSGVSRREKKWGVNRIIKLWSLERILIRSTIRRFVVS